MGDYSRNFYRAEVCSLDLSHRNVSTRLEEESWRRDIILVCRGKGTGNRNDSAFVVVVVAAVIVDSVVVVVVVVVVFVFS